MLRQLSPCKDTCVLGHQYVSIEGSHPFFGVCTSELALHVQPPLPSKTIGPRSPEAKLMEHVTNGADHGTSIRAITEIKEGFLAVALITLITRPPPKRSDTYAPKHHHTLIPRSIVNESVVSPRNTTKRRNPRPAALCRVAPLPQGALPCRLSGHVASIKVAQRLRSNDKALHVHAAGDL